MTAGGVFYPQPNWERRIKEIDCGLLPTPTVTNAQYTSEMAKRLYSSGKTLWEVLGGYPSQAFREWMMGLPIGWVSTAPLAMLKFHLWLQQHGVY